MGILDAGELMQQIKFEAKQERDKQVAFLGEIADANGYDDVIGKGALKLWDDIIKGVSFNEAKQTKHYQLQILDGDKVIREVNFATKEQANTYARIALRIGFKAIGSMI